VSQASVHDRFSPTSRFAVRFIAIYRANVSHRVRTACRFEPSCSAYGLEAYQAYGFFTATAKTLRRLMRCRPGYEGPLFDPP
jgi:hypothetical protein